MGSEFVNEVLQEQLGNQFSGLLGGQNFDASQMNATDVANLPPTVQNALEAIQRGMAGEAANPGVDATGNVIGGKTGLLGTAAGFKADGQISRGGTHGGTTADQRIQKCGRRHFKGRRSGRCKRYD